MGITVGELTALKNKIDSAKTRKARAEGQMEKIEEGWKRDFGVEGRDAAEAKLKSLREDVAKDEERLNKLLKEIEEAAPWDKL
jgi:uncharacterized protein YPO0396